MHITESLMTGCSWKENVLRGSWGTAEGLSPSLFLSWTKTLFVPGVSSWPFSTCNIQGSSKRKSRERRPYGFQHIEHQWAPDGKPQQWQNGQLVVSLLRRQNAIFWQPSCREQKSDYSATDEKNTYEDTCKFLKTGSLQGWKARCFKAQEARYRGIKSKMCCIRSPYMFENCSYQIEIHSQIQWIVSPQFRKLQITSDSLNFH